MNLTTIYAMLGAAALISSVAATTTECPAFISDGVPTAAVDARAGTAVLANNFLCVQLAPGRVASVRADFAGGAAYGKNVLAGGASDGGFALEREDADGAVHRSAGFGGGLAVAARSGSSVTVAARGVGDASSVNASLAREDWWITLGAGDRFFALRANGTATRAAPAGAVRALRHAWGFAPASLYALFDTGVVQLRNARRRFAEHFSHIWS